MSATVLVVDDEPGMQSALQAILEFEGFLVRVARDGLEALQALTEGLPDVIVLDLVMPRMDGIAFLEALRANGTRSRVRVLLLSAHTRGRERPATMGADAYMGKPFEIDDLVDKVRGLLPSDQ